MSSPVKDVKGDRDLGSSAGTDEEDTDQKLNELNSPKKVTTFDGESGISRLNQLNSQKKTSEETGIFYNAIFSTTKNVSGMCQKQNFK